MIQKLFRHVCFNAFFVCFVIDGSAHLPGVRLAQQKAQTLPGEAILVHPVGVSAALQVVVVRSRVQLAVLVHALAPTHRVKDKSIIVTDLVLTPLARVLLCSVYLLVRPCSTDLPASSAVILSAAHLVIIRVQSTVSVQFKHSPPFKSCFSQRSLNLTLLT